MKHSQVLSGSKRFDREGIGLLLIALPFIIFIFMFNYIPLFGWIYAFFHFKPGISLYNSTFAGFEYFRSMFDDPDIARVLTNTIVLSFLNILCTPLPAILAIMLTEVRNKTFKKLIQTTTTLPYFISWVIVFSIAFTMFSTDGLVNQIVSSGDTNREPVNILGNIDIVWAFQTAVNVWKSLGWSAIIYIAAITGIDSDLYEAATIDGAGRFKCILHITIPGMIPTFLVLLLLSVSNILSAGFEQYLVFYNSMVADRIEVLDLYIYRIGLVTHDYSYATAVGMFKSVISIVLLFIVNNASKRLRGEKIF